MKKQKKRHVGKDVASSELTRVEPDTRQVRSHFSSQSGEPPLPEFPALWFWRECAKAQLRTLTTNPAPQIQGMAMWRYCVCLAHTNGSLSRWTGYTAGVIKGHAANAKGSQRWRASYLQGMVDFAAVWVPLVVNEYAGCVGEAEILQVDRRCDEAEHAHTKRNQP